MDHLKLLAKVRTRLVVDYPFFASVMLRKELRWTQDLPTAGISPTGTIYINPAFFCKLSVEQGVFLMAHEAMHYLSCHFLRLGPRDAKKWNWATDAVINEILKQANVGEFIPEGVELPGAEKRNAEDVYAHMPESPEGGGGPGEHTLAGDILPGEGAGKDGKASPPMTSEQAGAIEAQAKLDAAQARRAAKMMGKMPAALERFVDQLVNVVTPWHSILERYMHSFRLDDLSWSRPNKRYRALGMYLPGKNYVPEMGTVVIGVDTSGSIGPDELKHFGGHVKRILEDCRPEKVYVVYCDAAVNRVDEFEAADDLEMHCVGGGGTAFRPVFQWVEEQGISPDVLVYLTDLHGDTNFKAPPYETLWVSTGSHDAQFGVVIPYTLE